MIIAAACLGAAEHTQLRTPSYQCARPHHLRCCQAMGARLHTVHLLPQLQLLDGSLITAEERLAAANMHGAEAEGLSAIRRRYFPDGELDDGGGAIPPTAAGAAGLGGGGGATRLNIQKRLFGSLGSCRFDAVATLLMSGHHCCIWKDMPVVIASRSGYHASTSVKFCTVAAATP